MCVSVGIGRGWKSLVGVVGDGVVGDGVVGDGVLQYFANSDTAHI